MPMYVNGYSSGGKDSFGYGVAAVQAPPIQRLSGAITGAANNFTAFTNDVTVIEVHTEEETSINIGLAAVADPALWRMGPGETRYYTIPAGKGWRISGITPT